MNEICIILGVGQEIKYFKETVTITCMKLVLTPPRAFLAISLVMLQWFHFSMFLDGTLNEFPFAIHVQEIKINFLRGQASAHCITSSPKNMKHFLSIRVRQPSVVLRTVYTVRIAASASILLTQTSWLGRSTLELNLWFVPIFCLRSYPLFNYHFILRT